jgi:teichoic acid transport system permease protein
VISRVLTFGFELAVLGAVALVTGEGVSRRWLALPLILLVHSALNLGGAFITARLNDAFRDVQQIIPFLFRLLVYVSGVMIPLDRYLTDQNSSDLVRRVIGLNPIVIVLNVYRWAFLGTPVAVSDVVKLVVMAAAILAVGFWFFRAAEWRYGRA